MTELERYLAVGRSAGCSADQMNNFVRAGVVLQERQLAASAAARLCDRGDGPTAVGYGGARGGGKSHWLLAQMGADDCQRVSGLKCLLLRKVGKANMEHFEDLRRRLFTGLAHEFSAYRGVLTFGNGSRIIAGHFQAEKDIDAYLGLEYDVIGIEEATTLSSRKHQDILWINGAESLVRSVNMKPFMEIPHKMGFCVQIPEGLEFLDGPENLRRYYAARGAENPQLNHWATGDIEASSRRSLRSVVGQHLLLRLG